MIKDFFRFDHEEIFFSSLMWQIQVIWGIRWFFTPNKKSQMTVRAVKQISEDKNSLHLHK
jgi:hypothetical protein